MSTTDYVLQITLVLIVVRQIRESKLDLMTLLLPLGLVVFSGVQYLHAIPSGGNDLVLIGGLTALGAALGLGSGLATHMRRGEGRDVLVRAGWVAAGLWVAGMGLRLVVQVGADHGLADTLTRFSVEHAITGASAWTAAFVLMAYAQVIVRLVVIRLRAHRLTGSFGLGRRPVAA